MVPPHNLEIEGALLGSLMLDATLFEHVDGVIAESDFYSNQNATIFAAIRKLASVSKPIDKISIVEYLRSGDTLTAIGGPQYLTSLMDEIPSTASTKYYIQVIREKSSLRELMSVGRQIHELALDGEFDVELAIRESERLLRSLIDRGTVDVDLDRHRQLAELYDAVEAAGKREDWLTSPFPSLDALVGGFDEGELIMWVAPPKVGKSGLVLTLADWVARMHGPSALFASEMNRKATMRRHLAQLSGVSARKQRRGNLSPLDWEGYAEATALAGQAPLHIFGREQSSIQGIRRTLRELERKEGKVQSVFIDHVGFIAHAASDRESTHEKMDRTYRALLDLADEFRCPVHAVQHSNRAGYATGQAPTLANIRDGGNAEGHAHGIIFINRPYMMGDAATTAPDSDAAKLTPYEQKQIGELIVLASRDGEAGTIPMRYTGHKNLWEEAGAQLSIAA
jgi:replicative DNA helicase